jgi:hypothetical protein
MRLPKQRVMQLYCLVRPYFRKRKVQRCDGSSYQVPKHLIWPF